MSLARAASTSLRAAQRSARATPQLLRQSARRGYASGAPHGPKAGSDLPWAVGGVAVAVPALWYLLRDAPSEALHPHGPHTPHGEEHEEKEEHEEPAPPAHEEHEVQPEAQEEAVQPQEPKEEPKEESKEQPEGQAAEAKQEPEASKDETKQAEEVHHEAAANEPTAVKPAVDMQNVDKGDFASPAKASGGWNTESGKQERFSNADTVLPVDVEGRISHKGEGSPDSTKSKGTVDVGRPETGESKEGGEK